MINNDELLFVDDENNNPLKPKRRSLVHKEKLFHRTTGIWLVNKKKQILCQKRSMNKDTKPGYWEAFFGGHLGSHETYLDNAKNEMNEELGISIQKEDLISYKLLKSNKSTHKEFQQIYLILISESETDFTYEKEEIDELQWLNIEIIKNYLTIINKSNWVHKPWDKELLKWIEDSFFIQQ